MYNFHDVSLGVPANKTITAFTPLATVLRMMLHKTKPTTNPSLRKHEKEVRPLSKQAHTTHMNSIVILKITYRKATSFEFPGAS